MRERCLNSKHLIIFPFFIGIAVLAGHAYSDPEPSAYLTTDISQAVSRGPKVFIVQDPVLSMSDPQKAASELEILLRKERISLLLVPGAFGDVSLSYFRKRVPPETRFKAAGDLLRRGRLTLAEYLDLTSEKELVVWGVDDADLYARTLQLIGELLRHAPFFERLRVRRENDNGLHRFLGLEATDQDLDAYDTKISPWAAPLLELYSNSETRVQFLVSNVSHVLKEKRAGKAVLFVSGALILDLKNGLEENKISYEELSLRNEVMPEEDSLEKRLFTEAGLKAPRLFRPSVWKSLFLRRAPLSIRPVREALAMELLRDQRPSLWDMAETLGLSPEQRMQAVLSGLTSSSLDMFKKNKASHVHFSWAEGLSAVPSTSENLREGILNQIEKNYDEKKYAAFKELMGRVEHPKDGESFALQYADAYEQAILDAERIKEEKKKSLLKIPWMARLVARVHDLLKGIPSEYPVRRDELQKVVRFLRANKTGTGMPLSFKTTPEYWKSLESPMDEVDAVIERLLTTNSVSIYDAALWQIGLALLGDKDDKGLINDYTERLLSGRSGGLAEIRASDPVFRYGDEKKVMPAENAYFFRMIADEYIQQDPLGEVTVEGFPNFALLHHEDWKPITGEQAWGAIIGPLQTAYRMYNAKIPEDSAEMRLALSILPAVEAMRAPNGAFYHAPEGTYGKNPNEISNENNASMYSALGMLHTLLGQTHPREAEKIKKLMRGQLEYFRRDGFDHDQEIFYQGGIYLKGVFSSSKIFAVDCQTWAINALGPRWIDETFGYGTAYRIWKNTKKRAGYFDESEILRGVGFTDGHDMNSIEWTCGAILSARVLAGYYKDKEPAWAEELKRDAVTMRYGIEEFKETQGDGSVAYFYANKRYFIPWGWWANPIPSLASSAWVLMIDTGFDPFILGGGPEVKETLLSSRPSAPGPQESRPSGP